MPPALLPSQFAILEPLQPDENGVEVSIEGSVEEMVERAVAAVNEYAAKVAAQSQQAEGTAQAATQRKIIAHN